MCAQETDIENCFQIKDNCGESICFRGSGSSDEAACSDKEMVIDFEEKARFGVMHTQCMEDNCRRVVGGGTSMCAAGSVGEQLMSHTEWVNGNVSYIKTTTEENACLLKYVSCSCKECNDLHRRSWTNGKAICTEIGDKHTPKKVNPGGGMGSASTGESDFDDDRIPDDYGKADNSKGKGGVIGFLVVAILLAVVGVGVIVWLRNRAAFNSIHKSSLMKNSDAYEPGESSADMTPEEAQKAKQKQRVAISEA